MFCSHISRRLRYVPRFSVIYRALIVSFSVKLKLKS